MKWFALALAGALVGIPVASAAASPLLTLDLSNWGEGVYYLKGRVLGTESNNEAGFQDAPTLVGNAAGDAIILP